MSNEHQRGVEAATKAWMDDRGIDDRFEHWRESIAIAIDAYLAELNAEAEFYTTKNNLENLWMTGIGVVLDETEDVWDAAKQCWERADTALFSAPVGRGAEAGRAKAEAFDRIVAARKKHVDAVAAYNARRELANAERMRGSWAIKLDTEYHAMSDAQSEFHRTVQDLADTALRNEEKSDG